MEKKISVREQKYINTKNRLYMAGLKLFQEIGYKDCDLRTICKEAGIGLGTFYNYFKDKLSLYLYIFETEFLVLSKIVIDKDEIDNLKQMDKRELVHYIVNFQMMIHKHSSLFYREAELLLIQEPKVKELKTKLLGELLTSIKMLLNSLNILIDENNIDVKLTIINNTIEETIYLILDKSDEDKRIYLKELAAFVYSYLF